MKAARIAGTITLTDGTTAEFLILGDGTWSQWGHADSRRAGDFVDVLDALTAGLADLDVLTEDDGDEDDTGEVDDLDDDDTTDLED